ncbi:MAG: MFS transporter [Parafilimonas sp.]
MSQPKQPTNYSALGTLVTVFFFWGFIAASNGIFIPFCKKYFQLSQFQSQLIDTAFYGAYYIGSYLLFLSTALSKIDILNKIGYRKGIIAGLCISIAGALIMIPAVNSGNFFFILGSFFVIALGFSLQQTAAQPFAISLGDPSTGSHRLNLGGSVNSFGTTMGPLIVSIALFGSVKEGAGGNADIGSIKSLYLIVAGVFLLAALIFIFSKRLPSSSFDEHVEKSNKALGSLTLMTLLLLGITVIGHFTDLGKLELTSVALILVAAILFYSLYAAKQGSGNGWGAMKYPQLILGMIAIFVYVGVEVTIQSNMGALLKTDAFGAYNESHISPFISLYWGSLMIGRWTGAVSVFNLTKQMKRLLTIVVPYIAFAIILLVNILRGNDVGNLYYYVICIAVLIAAIFYGQEKPAKTLLTLAALASIAMVIGMLTTGIIATYAFMSGGLFCSMMWPCIFSLAVAGLGKYTSEGSAFLIMMILGGAIIPPLQGALSDKMSIHTSYIVPMIGFMYLAWHAIKTRNVLKAQGLDFDSQIAGGH